jgi:alkanesulfonate monooxygenase SsuD/methylene tetrahydromethanopterin reductase-like flavin-dependent oxidoreductase (luciferase family)
LGVYAVWTAEAYGSDAVSPLAWLGTQTKNIKLGTAIMQMPWRTPANATMTAMTLNQLSNGRFLMRLGLLVELSLTQIDIVTITSVS